MSGGLGCAETVNNNSPTPRNVSEERRSLLVAYNVCSLGYRPKGFCKLQICFPKCQTEIPVRGIGYPDWCLRGFLHFLQENSSIAPQLCQDHFLPNPLKFNIHHLPYLSTSFSQIYCQIMKWKTNILNTPSTLCMLHNYSFLFPVFLPFYCFFLYFLLHLFF